MVNALAPCTVRPVPVSAMPPVGLKVRLAAVASIAPPLAVMLVPNRAGLANCATPPLSAVLLKLVAPPSVQVPLLTRRLPKLMYCEVLSAAVPAVPLPVPVAEFCRIKVLVPPAPPSTVPVAAKLNNPPGPSSATPMPPALLTLLPVTAVKLLMLLAPIDTLPLMAPELMKVLPVAELWKPTRPSMVPEFTALTVAPPLTAMTGVSEPSTERFNRGRLLMVPALLICTTPAGAAVMPSAMPSRLSRLAPSRPPLP